jgi:phage gp29-like protein
VHLYEILIRMNPDGTVRGAHQADIEIIADEGGVIAEKELPAVAINPDDVSRILGAQNAGNLSEIAELKARLEEVQAALTVALEGTS